MNTYKPFTTSDISITPFKVNKDFTFRGASEFTSSNVGIDRFFGTNYTSSLFKPDDYPTGQIKSYNEKAIYESIKLLYYGNYLSGSDGSPAQTSSIRVDGVRRAEGGNYQPMYYNYLANTLDANRLFPTGSDDRIGVISIPSNLFGEYIKPGTFSFQYTGSSTGISGKITDDGEGSLFNAGTKVGDIIYQHGMLILTAYGSSITGSVYGTALYGTGVYGASDREELEDVIIGNNITCSFQSTMTIYESQYKCTLLENEFNSSNNPTIISQSSNGTPYDFATGSYFQPYITTVGLYNNSKELLAVGKLAQPLQSSNTTDTTIMINIDL